MSGRSDALRESLLQPGVVLPLSGVHQCAAWQAGLRQGTL